MNGINSQEIYYCILPLLIDKKLPINTLQTTIFFHFFLRMHGFHISQPNVARLCPLSGRIKPSASHLRNFHSKRSVATGGKCKIDILLCFDNFQMYEIET